MEIKLFDSIKKATEKLENRVPRRMRIGGHELGVARIDDQVKVYENLCPHLKETLHNGIITRRNEIICPLHGYRYNLMSGEESSQKTRTLKIYPVSMRQEGVFVELADSEVPDD